MRTPFIILAASLLVAGPLYAQTPAPQTAPTTSAPATAAPDRAGCCGHRAGRHAGSREIEIRRQAGHACARAHDRRPAIRGRQHHR